MSKYRKVVWLVVAALLCTVASLAIRITGQTYYSGGTGPLDELAIVVPEERGWPQAYVMNNKLVDPIVDAEAAFAVDFAVWLVACVVIMLSVRVLEEQSKNRQAKVVAMSLMIGLLATGLTSLKQQASDCQLNKALDYSVFVGQNSGFPQSYYTKCSPKGLALALNAPNAQDYQSLADGVSEHHFLQNHFIADILVWAGATLVVIEATLLIRRRHA